MNKLNKIPKDEDEKDEESKERGDIVHRAQHDEELIAKRRQEPHYLQYPQETECP